MQKEEESGGQQLPVSEEEMRRAADLIARAKRLVVFSGAGISAESGIATFRDPEMGLWTSKIGLAWFGTPVGWRWTPGLAWRMYLSRFRDPIARARPNPGHYAIARLEQLIDQGQALGKDVPRHFDILTQNVDGLHQRAGNKETSVAELHGTVNRHICSKHRHPHPYVIDPSTLAEDYDPEKDEFFTHDSKKVPRCQVEGCGSYLRPDAVLFMESLPSHAWNAADHAVSSLRQGDVMLVVGTSGVVYPAASLPEEALEKRGVHVIEINPVPSAISSRVSMFLKGPSGQILPPLVDMVRERWQLEGSDGKKNERETSSESEKDKVTPSSRSWMAWARE